MERDRVKGRDGELGLTVGGIGRCGGNATIAVYLHPGGSGGCVW